MKRQAAVSRWAIGRLTLPAPLLAEGAVRELLCPVAARDPNGACTAGGGLAIRLIPTSNVAIGKTQARALRDGACGALERTTGTASRWPIPSGPSGPIQIERPRGGGIAAKTRRLACSGARTMPAIRGSRRWTS